MVRSDYAQAMGYLDQCVGRLEALMSDETLCRQLVESDDLAYVLGMAANCQRQLTRVDRTLAGRAR
jgi:hypothetical protein